MKVNLQEYFDCIQHEFNLIESEQGGFDDDDKVLSVKMAFAYACFEALNKMGGLDKKDKEMWGKFLHESHNEVQLKVAFVVSH